MSIWLVRIDVLLYFDYGIVEFCLGMSYEFHGWVYHHRTTEQEPLEPCPPRHYSNNIQVSPSLRTREHHAL